MIQVQVWYNDGLLRRLCSEGHAVVHSSGAASAPCAVVSNVLGALGRACLSHPALNARGSAPGPGSFELEVVDAAPEAREYLLGLSRMVRLQLQAAADGFPKDILLDITDEE